MSCNPENWTLEDLLRMDVTMYDTRGMPVGVVPNFRVSVQREVENGVHFIIHADGYNSPTLDLVACGNMLHRLEDVEYDEKTYKYVIKEAKK